jgi:hypothetical protein
MGEPAALLLTQIALYFGTYIWTGYRDIVAKVLQADTEGKRHFFLSFPYVRPEPVLVK